MQFLSHFLRGLGLDGVDVPVTRQNPVERADFDSRKTSAAYCEAKVREGLLASLGLGQETIPAHYLQAVGRIQ